MRSTLLRWWPALPALMILYLSSGSFLAKYPRFSDRSHSRAAASRPDTLLTFARKGLSADSAEAGRDTLSNENPFRTMTVQPAGHGRGRPAPPPPPRNYILRGTVGSNVATITNLAGQKLILKTGETIDSAVIISIEPNKVVLKDRAGKFELMTEK